jgi:hypothetical protein
MLALLKVAGLLLQWVLKHCHGVGADMFSCADALHYNVFEYHIGQFDASAGRWGSVCQASRVRD